MVKKFIALMLALILVFSFCSCGQISGEKNDKSKPEKEERYEENNEYEDITESVSEVVSKNASESVLGNVPENAYEDVTGEVTSVHRHSYTDATCLAASECEECGEVLGNALGHDYVDGSCVRCGCVDPASLPTNLNDLFLIDSTRYTFSTTAMTDSFGNVYSSSHSFTPGSVNFASYAIFNMNGEYKTFTGSIVMPTGAQMETEMLITIYVDDVLKYEKIGYNKTTDKVDFSVDVSGGKMLKIQISSNKYDSCRIVNAQLTK